MKLPGGRTITHTPPAPGSSYNGATNSTGTSLNVGGVEYAYHPAPDGYWFQTPGDPPGSWWKRRYKDDGTYTVSEYVPQDPETPILRESGTWSAS